MICLHYTWQTVIYQTLTPFPNVKVVCGTAEVTTIHEHSIDVITVAHALHLTEHTIVVIGV